jgi:hypothetical protein
MKYCRPGSGDTTAGGKRQLTGEHGFNNCGALDGFDRQAVAELCILEYVCTEPYTVVPIGNIAQCCTNACFMHATVPETK